MFCKEHKRLLHELWMVHLSLINPIWFMKMNSRITKPSTSITTIKERIHALTSPDRVQEKPCTARTSTRDCSESAAGEPSGAALA